MQVTTTSGIIYEGIFDAAQANGDVCLSKAHKLVDQTLNVEQPDVAVTQQPVKTHEAMLFGKDNIICISAANIELEETTGKKAIGAFKDATVFILCCSTLHTIINLFLLISYLLCV